MAIRQHVCAFLVENAKHDRDAQYHGDDDDDQYHGDDDQYHGDDDQYHGDDDDQYHDDDDDQYHGDHDDDDVLYGELCALHAGAQRVSLEAFSY